MIRNYRMSTVFVERSHLLAGDRARGTLPERAEYERLYDLAGKAHAVDARAWAFPGDATFWRMWCGGKALPDGYGAWRAAVPVREQPTLHLTETGRRADVKLEIFAHAHTRAAIVSCLSRHANLDDPGWIAELRALRTQKVFSIRTPSGAQAAEATTMTALGRLILNQPSGPQPAVPHPRLAPFTVITPCSDDGAITDWTEDRRWGLAARALSVNGSRAEPTRWLGSQRRPVETYVAGATAVLIGARWLTAAGRPSRLSHYHRNLALGIMQVQALLQLVAELDAVAEDEGVVRHSTYESARNAVLMLRRVENGRGTYRSNLLADLIGRHAPAMKRVASILDCRPSVAR